jgi:hypothetical protein
MPAATIRANYDRLNQAASEFRKNGDGSGRAPAAREFRKESKRAEAAEKRRSGSKPSPLKVRNSARRRLEVDSLRAKRVEGLLREFVAALDFCWKEDFDLSQTPFTQDLHDRAVAELQLADFQSDLAGRPDLGEEQ